NFLVSYSIMKTLNNSSSGSLQDISLLRQAKGLLPFDRPQILNLSYTYDLPFGKGRRFLGGGPSVIEYVLGGWQIAGTNTYQRGAPVVVSGQANITSWVNRVPGAPIRTSTSCSAYNPNDPTSPYLTIASFNTPRPCPFVNTYPLPTHG